MSKENIETEIYETLTGAYKHFCPDWDEMAIDENCFEFASCGCFRNDSTAMEIKEYLNDLIDAQAERIVIP